jgi:integrase
MAVFTIAIRGKRGDGHYPVYICVNHKSKPAYIKTHFAVGEKGVKTTYTKSGKGKLVVSDAKVIRECMNDIADYVKRLNDINADSMTVQEIVAFLDNDEKEISFTDFANRFIEGMKSRGRNHSSLNYIMAVKRLHEYTGKRNILFPDLTSKVIGLWIDSMMDSARKRELYPSCIRKIFLDGMVEYNDEDREIFRIKNNPFARVSIPKAKTPEKRNLDVDTVRAFFNISPEVLHGREILALDVCRIVFCMAGINVADLYDLKTESLTGNFILKYRRKKTRDKSLSGSYMEITVPEIIRDLFQKYRGEKSLLCFAERYSSAQDFSSMIAKMCKRICGKAGMEEKISPYSFRHSWATIAINECGASMDDVAFSLNHVSAHRITSIYVKPDYGRVDRLNAAVISRVFNQI